MTNSNLTEPVLVDLRAAIDGAELPRARRDAAMLALADLRRPTVKFLSPRPGVYC